MSKRFVVLGSGQKVGLGAYVAAWRKARKAAPETIYLSGLTGFGMTSGEEILRDFRAGMHARINLHDRRLIVNHLGRRPRKLDADWQGETRRAAHALNTPRLRIYWLPKHLRARFAGRIVHPGE